MIGDLVTFKDCQNDEVKTIIKIWGLNSDGDAFAFIDGFDALDEIQIDDDIVGIPLTPEILEKNKFVKSERFDVWKIISDNYELRITQWRFAVIFLDEDGSDNEEFSAPRPKYAHELQHILRLFGIDKEITV